jgi:hypothetical protein
MYVYRSAHVHPNDDTGVSFRRAENIIPTAKPAIRSRLLFFISAPSVLHLLKHSGPSKVAPRKDTEYRIFTGFPACKDVSRSANKCLGFFFRFVGMTL